MTDEQLDSLGNYQLSDAYNDRQKAILSFADTLTGSASVPEDVANRVKEFLSEEEFVELTVTVATANLSNRINNALKVPLD